MITAGTDRRLSVPLRVLSDQPVRLALVSLAGTGTPTLVGLDLTQTETGDDDDDDLR